MRIPDFSMRILEFDENVEGCDFKEYCWYDVLVSTKVRIRMYQVNLLEFQFFFFLRETVKSCVLSFGLGGFLLDSVDEFYSLNEVDNLFVTV